MSEARDYKVIGTRVVRPDGVDKVTGRANFGADFTLPGMLYGKVLRSPHAHARIKKIDTSAASAIEGVYAVVTGADFPKVGSEEITGGEGAGDFADLASNVMARDKVVYHGHAVAAVAAKSTIVADAALAAIKVEYEVLTPVMDLDAAMAENATLISEGMFTQGLPEKPTSRATSPPTWSSSAATSRRVLQKPMSWSRQRIARQRCIRVISSRMRASHRSTRVARRPSGVARKVTSTCVP